MGEYEFTAWRRYDHDRVYVQRAGERLGYLDRATGVLAVDVAVADDVRTALVTAGWLDAPPPPAVPALEWAITLAGDTATYRPGASARAQAQAERDAAPVRTALARVLRVHTDERAWRVGADGEESVARRLARLPESWTVVHDLPIGDRGANVDHLVVGPAGVFSLNTKNLTGNVWVAGERFLTNGQNRPYVRNARQEATRVGRLLGVPVTGAIVVLADDLTVKEQPRDVAVVGAARIRRWLQSRPPVLSPQDLAALVRRVRDPRTWGAPRA